MYFYVTFSNSDGQHAHCFSPMHLRGSFSTTRATYEKIHTNFIFCECTKNMCAGTDTLKNAYRCRPNAFSVEVLSCLFQKSVSFLYVSIYPFHLCTLTLPHCFVLNSCCLSNIDPFLLPYSLSFPSFLCLLSHCTYSVD